MKKNMVPLEVSASPRNEVRMQCADGFRDRIQVLTKIADNEKNTVTERLRAMDMLGKYGGLQQVDQTPENGSDEDKIVINYGNMTTEERREFLRELA